MLSIYIGDAILEFRERATLDPKSDFLTYNKTLIKEVAEQMLSGKTKGKQIVICDTIQSVLNEETSFFRIEKAAGGKVLNNKDEVLLIYRLNKWDLPKGKLEKGETIKNCALREVEEECGIKNLSIEEPLPNTYHVFKRGTEITLKITYWFLMRTIFKEQLTPQLSEGITEACFKKNKELEIVLQNSYSSLAILFP